MSRARLQEIGIVYVDQALKNLELLSSSLGIEAFATLASSFLSSISDTADPDMALNNFERFVSALSDKGRFIALCSIRKDVVAQFTAIFGASRFLSTFLVASADEAIAWFEDRDFLSRPAGETVLARRLAQATGGASDGASFLRAMRLFRKRELLRIGLRDLLRKADLQETVSELSDLAAVCLQKAYERADEELRKRFGRPCIENQDGTVSSAGFAVIAMGKLGGGELNFSSDVDLMYVYAADGETEGITQTAGSSANRITNHQYFVKLSEKMSALINEKTADGFVFRVDLRLRPEGQQGPLAQSLGGYEIYYESWGQTWERSALIKARPVAGDEQVGREFLDRITPFVFRKYLDYGAIAEIGDMKQKINKDVDLKGRTHRDVKLGYGGIREIEFVIQALQLIYGGRDRSLREKGSLKALHQLSQKGLISYEEQETLAKAYVFLRTVEHRIQLLDDQQTQTMPTDTRELRALARRVGYRERRREAELLLRDYSEHTRKVRRIYDELFSFAGDEEEEEGHEDDYVRLLDADTTEQAAVAMLENMGFHDPDKAYRNVMLLREGPAFVHQTPRSRKLFNSIFPSLFAEIRSSSDPDMALNHLESFLAAQGSWETFQSFVKIDAATVKVLIAVFANSEYLSRLLVSRPHFLQNMMETPRRDGLGTAAFYARELSEQLKPAEGITEKLDCLRRFKHQEEIRIGMADLLSHADQATLSRDLSRLAEACLDASLRLAGGETARRYGGSGSVNGLAIIGAGKLGGRELTYGSDLDIFFVYSESLAAPPPPGMTVFEYFSKTAEKTISFLSTMTREGFVFRVDTRLRPTGSKGPLVQSIEAFTAYYSSQAETWELQALLRARFAAGDRVVGAEFCSAIERVLYRDRDAASLARDVRAMRRRMEEELGSGDAGHFNIKQGPGGLVDIEFIVQYLQLSHGAKHRRVRVPGTSIALQALMREGLLAAEEGRLLRRAYLFTRRLVSRMRIISNQAASLLSRDPAAVHALARRLGYDDGDEPAGRKLIDDYESCSSQVRNLFNRIIA